MAEVKVEDINLEADKPEFAVEPKLFGKWSYDGIQCDDISLAAYLQVRSIKQQVYIPYTAGRYQQRKFKKVQCPIVERLVTMMMVSGGRNNGKKQMAMRIVKQVFELIHLLTGLNPLQVLVDAMKLGGAREDSTRIGKGGAVRRQAVDVSPSAESRSLFTLCTRVLPRLPSALLSQSKSAWLMRSSTLPRVPAPTRTPSARRTKSRESPRVIADHAGSPLLRQQEKGLC